MEKKISHKWEVGLAEARQIQEKLRSKLDREPMGTPNKVKTIAGIDASYSRKENLIFAAAVIFSYPQLEVLEERVFSSKAKFPYVPGLLAFREGPATAKLLEAIRVEPDVIIFDGQGVAHPRGIGIAAHLGLLFDKATIGVAKNSLVGSYKEPPDKVGSYSFLMDKNKKIGAVLRTRKGVRPVFVSAGFGMNLAASLEIVTNSLRGYRLPEPLRQAHLLSNRARSRQIPGSIS